MAIIDREIITNEHDEGRLIDEGKLSAKKTRQYVNNKDLYAAFVEFHKEQVWCEYLELPAPKMNDVIGNAIIKICTRCANTRHFVAYASNWKEEMIDNAIVTCAANAPKFNPVKYDNPFAYITMIAHNAMKEMLNKEYKQDYIKHKLFDSHKGFAAYGENVNEEHQTEDDDMYKDHLEKIAIFESSQAAKRNKKNASNNNKQEVSLDDYLS